MPNRARAAFTVIELLVAIALGAAVCLAGAAAVRSAGQCLAAGNRLALENGLFRAGVLAALDEVDGWAALDDPGDPSAQPLRAPSLVGANPFRPYPRGDDLDLDHSDPRNWWRGPALPLRPYGDYALTGRIGFRDVDGVADPVRAAYPERLKRLADTLGYYALVDYLPASSIYQYHAEDGTMPPEFSFNAWGASDPVNDPHFSMGGQTEGMASNIGRLGHCFAYAITANRPWADRLARAGFSDFAAPWSTTAMHAETGARLRLQPVAPDHWPRLAVEVRRMFYCGHAIDLAAVVLRDPLTGSTRKLQFTAVGTTLRGARQQRGLDAHAGVAP